MDDRTPQNAPASLSDTLADDAVAYRPVSSLAVLGAVLAAASVLALVSPWASALPYAAALVCFVAARSILADPDSRTGLPIAVAGLAVACVVTGAAYARGAYAARLHAEDARPVVELFLEELRVGHVEYAYQMTLPYDKRDPNPQPLPPVPGEEELAAAAAHDHGHDHHHDHGGAPTGEASEEDPNEQLMSFATMPVVRMLQKGEVVYRGHDGPVRVKPGRLVSSYRYEVRAENNQLVGKAVVQLERPVAAGRLGLPAWRVSDVRPAR